MSARIEGIEEDELRMLYDNKNMTQLEIANHYGVSGGTIFSMKKYILKGGDSNSRTYGT